MKLKTASLQILVYYPEQRCPSINVHLIGTRRILFKRRSKKGSVASAGSPKNNATTIVVFPDNVDASTSHKCLHRFHLPFASCSRQHTPTLRSRNVAFMLFYCKQYLVRPVQLFPVANESAVCPVSSTWPMSRSSYFNKAPSIST